MMVGWIETTLGEAYDVRDGTHDSPKYQSEGFPLITSKNLKSAGLNFDKVKYISQSDYNAINKRSAVHKGDVLFAMIGTIGNPIVVEDAPRFSIKNVALFKVPNNQDSYFLKHYLSSNFVKDKMSKEAKGTTQKFVGLGYLRKFPIKLPPLAEQKHIVAIVDEAFAGIDAAVANTENNLANARELFESTLNAVFTQKGDGWVEKTLGDVCIFHGGSQPPKAEFLYEQKDGYIRLIQIRDYKSDKHIVYIPKEKARRFCSGDDVMIGRYGPPLFQILRGIDGAYNVALMKALPKEGFISKDYLYYFLKNGSILRYIINASNRAAGQIGLNKATLEPYPIAFPDMARQAEIVLILEDLQKDVKRLETIYQQKLANLAELKQSILQKAFAGELTTLSEKEIEETSV